MTPTQRSKAALERGGWSVAIVERWNPHARIRQDLFGFADLLAVKAGEAPLLVQVTSGSNAAARIAKITNEPRALTCLRASMRIEVHGWRKVKLKRGGTAMRWAPRIVEVTEREFPCPSTPSALSRTPPA